MVATTALLEADCPRCGLASSTMDVGAATPLSSAGGQSSGYEAYCTCRRCYLSSIFELRRITGANLSQFNGTFINNDFLVTDVVTVIRGATECPAYVPSDIESVFDEAAKCLVTGCFDASGTMSRKVLDLTTRGLLPDQPDPEDRAHPDWIAWKVRKDLRLRLDLLFERGALPAHLRDLVSCVHEDGNDAAHSDISLSQVDAMDLQDFTSVVLEHVYTLPGQVAENVARRSARRTPIAQ